MTIECPKCGKACEGENVSGHIGYENYECDCGFEFVYDDWRSEYFDRHGNIVEKG